jgi:hypothetical protein
LKSPSSESGTEPTNFTERGYQSGSELDDWLQAEEEILHAEKDARVEEASEESFPASDPPAY